MIFFFRPRLTPRAFSFFISLLPFFFFSAGYDPAFFVCLFRRIVSGMFIVHCAGCHPACPSYPLIHSSFLPPSMGRVGVGLSLPPLPPFGISLFCIRQDWRIGNAALSLSPSMEESEGASLSMIFSLFLLFSPFPLAYSIFLLYLCTRLRYYCTILVC